MQSALDRRRQLLDMLMVRRQDTVKNLANEFQVSERTIRRDICILSHDFLICTVQGKGGGVRIPDGYYAGTLQPRLTKAQLEFLERLSYTLAPADRIIMREILYTLRCA